jgi:hypothetical protein
MGIHVLNPTDKVTKRLMFATGSVTTRLFLVVMTCSSDMQAYQIGPLLPPRVISTIMTFRGSVTSLLSMHHSLSCSFVVEQPTRTSLVSPLGGCIGEKEMAFNSVAGPWSNPSEVMFGIFIAGWTFRAEMRMSPFRPKVGDHECPV